MGAIFYRLSFAKTSTLSAMVTIAKVPELRLPGRRTIYNPTPIHQVENGASTVCLGSCVEQGQPYCLGRDEFELASQHRHEIRSQPGNRSWPEKSINSNN